MITIAIFIFIAIFLIIDGSLYILMHTINSFKMYFLIGTNRQL